MSFARRIWRHLVNPQSRHGQIARGLAWVSLFVLVGKLAGAAKEMAVAWRYGVSAEIDAYLFVSNLINWPISLWSSVLAIVLVPLAAQVGKGAAPDLPRFRSELLGAALLGGLLLLGLAWLGLPLLLTSGWAGLGPDVLGMALASQASLIWLLPLGALSAVYSAWMLAAGHHSNTLLESIPALVILLVLLLAPADGLGPLLWGTVAGAMTHLLVLVLLSHTRRGLECPRLGLTSRHWPMFLQGFTLVVAGQTVMSLIGPADQFFAVHLGAGAVATYSYANRVLALILALGATAVSRATMPVLAAGYVVDALGTARVVRHWGRLMFVLGLGFAALAIWLAPWGVALLFERGRFSAGDSAAVTEVLRYGLLQLPFYASGLVYVSWLTSQRRYLALFWISSVNLALKLIGNMVLVPRFGINGLMVSTVLMLASSLLMLLMVRRHGGGTGHDGGEGARTAC